MLPEESEIYEEIASQMELYTGQLDTVDDFFSQDDRPQTVPSKRDT